MSYKTLLECVNEALFETKYAPGEIVNFKPRGEHVSQYQLATDEALIGIVKQLVIDSERQFYDIETEDGRFFEGIHESNVWQDTGTILTRNKI